MMKMYYIRTKSAGIQLHGIGFAEANLQKGNCHKVRSAEMELAKKNRPEVRLKQTRKRRRFKFEKTEGLHIEYETCQRKL